ncbi:hypothetical protein N7451_001459 [Penicillium sp. IBT 35674x]|nr:hypothetical protein N7451_001459 [Penicillium sp. IBT 35674x]
MLLSLPAELIQLILRSCDSPSFQQTAFTSRTLLELATTSRELVQHQLSQTPGKSDYSASLTTRQLFKLLLHRSIDQLLFGIENHFERRAFTFSTTFGGKVIDSRASSLLSLTNDAGTRTQVLLVFQNDSTVYLFGILNGRLTLQQRCDVPAKRYGNVQVLHTALENEQIYVLHRFKPFIADGPDSDRPFVKQAQQSNPHGNIFLATFQLGHPTAGICIHGFPDESDYEPLSFAVEDEQFAISWQHIQHAHDHRVVLYKMEQYGEMEAFSDHGPDLRGLDPLGFGRHDHGILQTDTRPLPLILASKYTSFVLAEHHEGDGDGEPTVKLAFNDQGQQLLHYSRGQTLYSSFQKIDWVSSPGQWKPTANLNGCNVTFTSSLSLSFSIGIPFYGTHQQGDRSHGSRCHWQYLALGIAIHRVEHWSVACLLRSEASPLALNCTHEQNIDRGRRFKTWKIMAQLGGFQESNTSTGSLIATSPQKTRIAMASWKTVTIWALEPTVLLNGEDGFYPESWQTEGGYPELRPAVIQLDAVCCQLRFTEKENELVAITDRGLMLLRLKPEERGIGFVNSSRNRISEEEVDISKLAAYTP